MKISVTVDSAKAFSALFGLNASAYSDIYDFHSNLL